MITISQLCNTTEENIKKGEPCLAAKMLMEMDVPNIFKLLDDMNLKSAQECADAIEKITYAVTVDFFLNNKDNRKNIKIKVLQLKFQSYFLSRDFSKNAKADGLTYFYKKLIRKNLLERLKIFKNEKNKDTFFAASEKIKKIYNFSDKDMIALRYFVCQASKKNYDPILNRSLYFWSEQKYTGKTTLAKILCGILNGYTKWSEISARYGDFKSEIGTELQFGRFDKPKAIFCGAVLMDEAFVGKDTSKYYGKLKEVLTSDTCKIEEKFGSVSDIACRRNYIFTSNKSIDSIIDDVSDRRIYSIEMCNAPISLSYDDLTSIVSDFVLNAFPAYEDEHEYYQNTMPSVIGRAGIEINDRKSYLTSESFRNAVAIERDIRNSQLNYPSFFLKIVTENCGVAKNESNAEFTKKAVIAIFGEPRASGNRRYYNVTDILKKLDEYNESIQLFNQQQEQEQEQEQNNEFLPF